MSQTSSYDVVVGAIATLMRVALPPTEVPTEPGDYSFTGYLEVYPGGPGLGGQTVNLVVDGVVAFSRTTIATGGWSFYPHLDPGATYLVKATFDGTADYEASETTEYSMTPSIPAPIPTVMEVTTQPPAIVDAGVTFNFDGNLREEVGLAGIVGRTIELYINGAASGDTYTTTTDGYWLFPISFPAAGTNSVQAVFPGDATYLGCHEELSTRGPLLAVAGVLAGLVGIACLRH